MTENNKLTEENIEAINKIMEENAESNQDIKLVQSLPSNNNVENSDSNEEGYMKKVNTIIDPNTGEHKILGGVEDDDEFETVDETTFEDLVAGIESGEIKVKVTDSPVTEEELKNNPSDMLDPNFQLSEEAIQTMLELVNRRMKKEEFNVYKAMPKEVQDMINKFMGQAGEAEIPRVTTNQSRALRNSLAEDLLDDYILKIGLNRAKEDLNSEIENIFKQGTKDIAEYSIGYTQERNKKYREYIDNLDDEEKKAKLTETLDVIDSAYTLEPLIEFAKTCKIKKYDIEQPKNYFRDFTNKYINSNYNIYDIKLALPVLERHIVDNEKYNSADVVAFIVCFCKYIRNFKVENVLEHSFMYYVIYNIIMIDANTSEKTIDVSTIFVENVKKVIDNLKERNSLLC